MYYSNCRGGTRRKTDEKSGITTIEQCNDEWQVPDIKVRKKINGSCGCAECIFELVCSGGQTECGLEDSGSSFTNSCNYETCQGPQTTCDRQRTELPLVNNSSFGVYIVINYRARSGSNTYLDYYLLRPNETVFINGSIMNLWVGRVGALANEPFIRLAESANTFVPNNNPFIEGYFLTGDDSCGTHGVISFIDRPVSCPLLLQDQTEEELLMPVQKDLNRFLMGLTLSEANLFFDGATVYFLSADDPSNYSYELESKQKGFKLIQRPNPIRFTYKAKGPDFFELLTPNQSVTRICPQPAIAPDLCFGSQVLGMVGEATGGAGDVLCCSMSFFTIYENGNSNLLLMPYNAPSGFITTEGYSCGIDNAIMCIEKLSVKARNQFLRFSKEAARQCCAPEGTFVGFQDAVCRDSDYTIGTVQCDLFATDYCNDPNHIGEAYCSCFPGAPIKEPVVKQVMDILESQGEKQPRKCLVKECKEGLGYKTAAMRNEECRALCLQIQNVIANGEYANIDFRGIQNLYCGGSGGGTDSDEKTGSGSGTSIALFTSGSIVILIGFVAILIARPKSNLWYILPVVVGLLLIGLGLYFHLKKKEPVQPEEDKK